MPDITDPDDSSWVASLHTTDAGDSFAAAGVGVVLANGLVLTCAHVIARHRDEPLWVAFPRTNISSRVRWPARVDWIAEGAESEGHADDVALLRLTEPVPSEVTPAQLALVPAPILRGELWWAFGFPGGHEMGSTATGTVGDTLSWGWVRLVTASKYVVRPGFSGGGLWIPGHGVVALVGQAEDASPTAGNGAALTMAKIDEILRKSASARTAGLTLEGIGAVGARATPTTDHAPARIKRRLSVGIAVVLAAAGVTLALVLKGSDPGDTNGLSGTPAAPVTAKASPDLPSTPSAEGTLAAEHDNCGSWWLLPMVPDGTASGSPPTIYVAACAEYGGQSTGARAVLKLRPRTNGLSNGHIARRIELRECGVEKPHTTLPHKDDGDAAEGAVGLNAGDVTTLETDWYAGPGAGGKIRGFGNVSSLTVTASDGIRWKLGKLQEAWALKCSE